MDDDLLATLIFTSLALIVLFIVLGVKSCDRAEKILDRDHSVKCYEQTQDKACWGIK